MKFPSMLQKIPSHEARPLRIGVWCDYRFTLTPKTGIGVFVYNLVAGLLSLDEPIEVVMLVRQGDQRVTDCLRESARGRLHVIPEPSWLIPLSIWMDQVAFNWTRFQDRLTLFREVLRNRLKDVIANWIKRTLQGNILLAVILLVGLPFIIAFVWTAYAFFQFGASTGLVLRLPFKILCDEIRKLRKRSESSPYGSVEIANAANCDVWLIPYLALTQPLPKPSVLVIHDLVTSHYPEGLDPTLVRNANRLAPARAAEATLCACMSSFIRDNDLLGTLGLARFPTRTERARDHR